MNCGDLENARSNYERSLALDPTHVESNIVLFDVDESLGTAKDA